MYISAPAPKIFYVGALDSMDMNCVDGIMETFVQDLLQYVVCKDTVHCLYAEQKNGNVVAQQHLTKAVKNVCLTSGVMFKTGHMRCNGKLLQPCGVLNGRKGTTRQPRRNRRR
jgi:hypothetical protein